ncbi:MAG: tetratricopeptide repeat protein [Candidatus Tantalella remota]|nr:tetratricopeptide repeat protein [Candidatus Tantalella remota]
MKVILAIVLVLVLSGVVLPRDAHAVASLSRELERIEKNMVAEGDFEESRKKLTSILGDNPGVARVYLDLGLAHYGLMEYGKAYDLFIGAETSDPDRGREDIIAYAIATTEDNRELLDSIEEANALFQGFADGDEKDKMKERVAAGHFTMLNVLLAGKYYYPSLVTPHIIWIQENVPELPGLYMLSGDVYYSAMFYVKASEDYKKALEEDPSNTALCRKLADCLVAAGDLDEAGEYYDKTIEIYEEQGAGDAPEVKKIRDIRNALPKRYKDISDLLKQHRYDEAEEVARRKMSYNPGDLAALNQLGQVYWDICNRRAAIKLFRKVAKRAPDYPPAHLFLGKAYIFERKPEKAIAQFEIFKEKMALLPKMDEDAVDFYASALHYISYIYFTMKKYDDVITECKKIIELKPDDQRAYYNLAVCYYVKYNSRSKAYAQLQKVIELDPTDRISDQAKYYIDYMRRNPDSRIIGDFTFLREE